MENCCWRIYTALLTAVLTWAMAPTASLAAQPEVIVAQAPFEALSEEGGPVLIDPGHGGIDGGTSVGGVLEKDLVLDIGLRLREVLLKEGCPVVMTRERDEDVSHRYPSPLRSRHARDLRNRVRIARESGTHLFVSIHVNHSSASGPRGAVILHEANDPAGAWLAELAKNQLAAVTGRAIVFPNRSLHVLRRAPCPAILVEVGYLSNPADRRALLDPAYRQRLAEALAGAIRAYQITSLVPPERQKKTPIPAFWGMALFGGPKWT
ncbi:N-acetylmuramoyl-L-alanine amidase family protein [Kyrpidia tusciae]|uniref:Cell wall hydrolase/autolysin n=1 Tax=Kyrpidia tusciae (strain DSM 2912 / NBRC 15312 / T2) TaxID=562970 RepID=D5WQM0_KYRT2|nr:N-acetylmuramoyl-L-alanine amidase [Kyrpidia tusciae]ADG06629.1 cell wall hydrolase/autolysin [Kyrpidia tusciae DSM 2912]